MLKRVVSRVVPERVKAEIKRRLAVPDLEASLLTLRGAGFRPEVVIDVGAYEGEFTLLCRRVFPDARVLMVEPQPAKRATLDAVARSLGNVEVASALLGGAPRESVPFFVNETVSSVLPEAEQRERPPARLLQMTTLDAITRGTAFASPDFIKLDVQGYELEVLRGGGPQLAAAEVVLAEANLIPIIDGAPLLHEAVAYMHEHGFRAYDVATFFRRPLDHALWQIDMLFARESSPLVASRRWE